MRTFLFVGLVVIDAAQANIIALLLCRIAYAADFDFKKHVKTLIAWSVLLFVTGLWVVLCCTYLKNKIPPLCTLFAGLPLGALLTWYAAVRK